MLGATQPAFTVKLLPSNDFYPKPSPRQGHTAMLLNNSMFIIGGRTKGNERVGRSYCGDCWKFDLENQRWSSLSLVGDVFTPRHNLAGGQWRNKLYIFGGQTDAGYSNEMFCIDPEHLTCTRVQPSGTVPTARHGHSCVVHGDVLVLFGGRDGHTPARFQNDLWCYDFNSNTWTLLMPLSKERQPCGRYYHSMCLHKGKLVVFGGYTWDGTENYFNDCYTCDIYTDPIKWDKIQAGKTPHQRNRALLLSYCDLLLLSGDLHVLGPREKENNYDWVEAFLSAPLPLCGHHTAVTYKGSIYIFGGECGNRVRLNDVYQITINKL